MKNSLSGLFFIFRESGDELHSNSFCATIQSMYFVYVLENKNDQSLYIGYTENLKQRIEDHSSGKGARTTRLKSGWRLIYFESYPDQKDALGREKFLKGGSGRKYLKKQLFHYFNGQATHMP